MQCLFQDFSERGEELSLIIERILILIRNVLYVPANPDEFRPDNDASVHDQVSGFLFLIRFVYCENLFIYFYYVA